MKPVEDNLGFDAEGKEYHEPDLNKYAGTISQVFNKLVKVYDDGSGDSGNDIVCDIERIMDADTCGDIISAAQAIEEQG